MSDGASVYECTSADEVIDLVQGGQGVFGIAVGRVWREVEGELAQLPSERADDEAPAAHPGDELRAPPSGPPDRLTPRTRRPPPLDTVPPGSGRRATARRTAPGPADVRLALLIDPAWESPRAHITHVGSCDGAPKGQPPRNLSGARTARARQLWSRPLADRGGGSAAPARPAGVPPASRSLP